MRFINVAAAKMGPIQRSDSRQTVIPRMLALMDEAKAKGADLIVYPELALTTFFPRWYMEDQAEVDTWFEHDMPNDATMPLFARAAEYQMAMSFGPVGTLRRHRHHHTDPVGDIQPDGLTQLLQFANAVLGPALGLELGRHRGVQHHQAGPTR